MHSGVTVCAYHFGRRANPSFLYIITLIYFILDNFENKSITGKCLSKKRKLVMYNSVRIVIKVLLNSNGVKTSKLQFSMDAIPFQFFGDKFV